MRRHASLKYLAGFVLRGWTGTGHLGKGGVDSLRGANTTGRRWHASYL